jgi:hypothetical protein
MVVPGVSVLVPPMPEPEGMPEEDPLLVEPPLPVSEGVFVLPPEVPELLLVSAPELFCVASPEPPPVVPAHALKSTAQAMGIIHLVINYSRKDKKAVRTTATYRKTA